MYEEIAGLTVNVRANIDLLKADLREAARLGSQFGRSITSAFDDAVFKGKDLGEVLRSLALSLARMTFRAAFQPLSQSFGTMMSQMFNGTSGTIMPSLFAEGGVVAAPTAFVMPGGGLGVAGEAGAEAILPLMRGNDGRLGVRANGGGRAVTVNFNVTSPDASSFKRSEVQINAMLNRAVARGERNL